MPTRSTFDLRASFSASFPLGAFDLVVQAVDAEGRVGPPAVLNLTATARPLPEGELVIALAWREFVDLDLRVVDPSGVEIWANNINSYTPPAPGTRPDASDAWQRGGILDFDSNQQCRIDGRNAENVVWTQAPPAGAYQVRLDTFSLCGHAKANWWIGVYRRGQLLSQRRGVSRPSDTRFDHGPGGGVEVLRFDVEGP